MRITFYNNEKCEILPNGDYKRVSDGKIVYTKTEQFNSIRIGRGGRIK